MNDIENADSLYDYIRLRQVALFRSNRTNIDLFSKITTDETADSAYSTFETMIDEMIEFWLTTLKK